MRLACLTLLIVAAACGPVAAQMPATVKVGVLSDMSGPFSDSNGPGSVAAAQLAAEDFAKEAPDMRVEIVSADHQNKPDVGLSIARRWIEEENVATIVDLPNSGVAMAIAGYMNGKHRATMASSAMTSAMTGSACTPTTVQWVSDTWAQGASLSRVLVRNGLKSWYYIAVDYALGKALEEDSARPLKAAGGAVAGVSRHPLNTADFASPLLAAQSSGAQVLALANTGADTINTLKQAAEFGLTQKMKIAALFVQAADVAGIGLPIAQGLQTTEAFYWDANDRTRAWSKRFAAKMNGRMPTEDHAGVYSSTLAFLRAVRAVKTIEGEKVVAAMRAKPFEDELFGKVELRADGRVLHDMYLFQVKTPQESTGPWDLYKLLATIPASESFRPLGEGGCPLK